MSGAMNYMNATENLTIDRFRDADMSSLGFVKKGWVGKEASKCMERAKLYRE